MRKWIFELGPFGAVSAPFTQAASPVRAPPLNLETAEVQWRHRRYPISSHTLCRF